MGFGNHLEKYEEAIICLDKAIELDPHKADAWYNKGHALAELEKYEEAIICLDKAIELDSSNSMIWNEKAVVLWRLGKNKEATECSNTTAKLYTEYYKLRKTKRK